MSCPACLARPALRSIGACQCRHQQIALNLLHASHLIHRLQTDHGARFAPLSPHSSTYRELHFATFGPSASLTRRLRRGSGGDWSDSSDWSRVHFPVSSCT